MDVARNTNEEATLPSGAGDAASAPLLTFDEASAASQSCTACELAPTRTTVVFGSGNPHAEVLFVGEGPGKQEDLGGKPFIGAAGKFLDELLATAGIVRDDIYITNIIKCRPPGNRNPRPDEIAACRPFLRAQIAAIAPKVIVTLGAFASHEALHTDKPISVLRGRPHIMKNGVTVFPVFHPAAALYDPTKRDVLLQDFAVLGQILAQEGSQERT